MVSVNHYAGQSGSISVSFNSPAALQPRITNSGFFDTITFRSGAALTFELPPYSMNLSATAPIINWGHTVGMCGNFKDNAADDFDSYVNNGVFQLLPNQQITYDLWKWKLAPASATATLPPYAVSCSYTAPNITYVVIAAGNAVDITNILRAVPVQTTTAPLDFQYDDSPLNVGATGAPFDKAAAQQTCTDAIVNSPLGKLCALLPGFTIQSYLDNCLIDLEMMLGDTRFVKDAVSSMQSACSAIVAAIYRWCFSAQPRHYLSSMPQLLLWQR